MTAYSDTIAKATLDFITGRVTPRYTTARTTYLGLLTTVWGSTDPTLASLVEPTSAGYARKQVSWAAPVTSAGVTTIANSAAVIFGPFTAAGGLATCNWAFLTTAASGTSGDVVELFILGSPLSAVQNDSTEVNIGQLVLTSS